MDDRQRLRELGGGDAVGGVDEIFEFFAGLEEGNLFGRDFDFGAGLGVAADATATLARAEAAEAANFDLVAFLKSVDDALENSLDDGFRLLAREFGYFEDLFNEVGLRQCRLLRHLPVASWHCHLSVTEIVAAM